MYTLAYTILLGSAALAAATPLAQQPRIKLERDVTLPEQWRVVGKAAPSQMLDVVVAVKQSNIRRLEEHLLKVSDPTHASYGQHLSLNEVNRLVAPSAQATAAIDAFVEDHQCERSASKDFVRCALNVSAAESLLACSFHEFEHTSGYRSVQVHPDRGYTLPASVAAHVDFVSPTVRFPSLRPTVKKLTKAPHEAPLRVNTPATLRSLYELGKVEGNVSANKQSCTAFLGQFYKPVDLKKFYKTYYPIANGRTVKTVGPDSGMAGVEASLDVQYISSMGGGVSTEFWSFAGRAPGNAQNEPFLTWIFKVGNTSDADVPKIFSTSYGEAENTVGRAYMDRINAEFVKTGSRGITLLFATGDNGVSDDNDQCKGGRFAGQWPAGSVWVTGVGGTAGGARLYNVSEKAWDGSAGGFSDRWARPAFQADAVSAYLTANKAALPLAFHWNNTNSRAFPDVSAQATGFEVINGGMTEPVAGTSCACPTFSGILALLNDLRLAAGKTTLGYANPFFYKNAAAFNDITQGSNSAGIDCGNKGFSAAKGWDPVTGLGSPSYPRLAAAVMALP